MNINFYIRKLKKHYIQFYSPEEIEMNFLNLVGMEKEKETLKDAMFFFESLKKGVNLKIQPHTRYSLFGELGSGKSSLVYALAKEANVPIIYAPTSAIIASAKKMINVIDLIFKVSSAFPGGCIIHFQEFTSTQSLQSNQLLLFYNHFLSKIEESKNTVIFLSTTSELLALPAGFLTPDKFSKCIALQHPPLKAREDLFKMYIQKYNLKLAKDVDINRLARNTFGMYPKDVAYTVKEVSLYASRKNLESISMRDFNEIILSTEAGESNLKLSEKERISTAYHEAGHVIAAYYSNPNYILGRVEITPRAFSLGLTKEESGEEKFCMFRHDYINELIYCLGGMAAEQVIYGETSSGVSSDLRAAATYLSAMFEKLGMDSDVGPIIYDPDFGFGSNEFLCKVEFAEQKFIKELYARTIGIIECHKDKLEALAKALLEHEVLLGSEIKEILDKTW